MIKKHLALLTVLLAFCLTTLSIAEVYGPLPAEPVLKPKPIEEKRINLDEYKNTYYSYEQYYIDLYGYSNHDKQADSLDNYYDNKNFSFTNNASKSSEKKENYFFANFSATEYQNLDYLTNNGYKDITVQGSINNISAYYITPYFFYDYSFDLKTNNSETSQIDGLNGSYHANEYGLTIGIGIGRIYNAYPLYKAYRIEMLLKEYRLIDQYLSQAHINEIAKIITKTSEYSVNYPSNWKSYMMKDIIETFDNNNDKSNILKNYFIMMEIERIIFNESYSGSTNHGQKIRLYIQKSKEDNINNRYQNTSLISYDYISYKYFEKDTIALEYTRDLIFGLNHFVGFSIAQLHTKSVNTNQYFSEIDNDYHYAIPYFHTSFSCNYEYRINDYWDLYLSYRHDTREFPDAQGQSIDEIFEIRKDTKGAQINYYLINDLSFYISYQSFVSLKLFITENDYINTHSIDYFLETYGRFGVRKYF